MVAVDGIVVTVTVVISLASPGYDPDPTDTRPGLGPWTHGVPRDPASTPDGGHRAGDRRPIGFSAADERRRDRCWRVQIVLFCG
jgi:hypothetical protein